MGLQGSGGHVLTLPWWQTLCAHPALVTDPLCHGGAGQGHGGTVSTGLASLPRLLEEELITNLAVND